MFTILVIDDQGGQIVFFVEWDNCQKSIARQRKVLGDVGSTVPMPVFLPHMVVALVVVFVFHAPMVACCPTEPRCLVRR